MNISLFTHSLLTKIILPSIVFALLFSPVHASTILHAFEWHYSAVEDKAQEIADIGYTAVLVAPPHKSSKYEEWYNRYQPQDFRTIEHARGNKEDFVAMIDALTSKGVDVYADVIVNHMANERTGNSDYTFYPGDYALSDYAAYRDYWDAQTLWGNIGNGLFSPPDFHDEKCIQDYNNVGQAWYDRICGDGDRGLPDLKFSGYVVDQIRTYLQSLKDLGVKGFRLDAAKHMSYDHLNNIMYGIRDDMLIFGEIIVDDRPGDDGAHDRFLAPYLTQTGLSAYDFPLFKTIREAFSFGGDLGHLGYLSFGESINRENGVTFAITHDIPNNRDFRYQIMNSRDEFLAHVYLMGRRQGLPLIYSPWNGEGAGSLRPNGEPVNYPGANRIYNVYDNGDWLGYWDRYHTKKMVEFRNRMEGQGEEVVYASGCALVIRRGKEGFFGINKCGSDEWASINTNERFYWYRNYRDVFTGDTVWIDRSNIFVRIPARGSAMWYAD